MNYTKAQLIELIDQLTDSYIYASECGGDLHCFFCGEFFVTVDDSENHAQEYDGDCPYIEARKLITEWQINGEWRESEKDFEGWKERALRAEAEVRAFTRSAT